MVIILEILAAVLGLILLLLLLITACRTRLALRGQFSAGNNQLSGEVALINGIVKGLITTNLSQLRIKVIVMGLPLPVYIGKIGGGGKKAPKPKAESPKKKSARRAHHMTIVEWLNFGQGIIKRIKGVVHFERIQADLTVGLATPAKTGMLLGAFYFARGALNWGSACQLQPDFGQKRLEGWIEAALTLHLMQLFPVGLFIFKQMKKTKKAGGDDVRGTD